MSNSLWFSILSKEAKYVSDEPEFFPSDVFDWTKHSKSVAEQVKGELLEYLQNHHLQAYFNTTMSEDVRKWKTVSLKWWGLEFYQNQKHFPKTTRFINSIPGLVSASFNLLEPHSRIFPHCGDTNGIYRCHLGLEIPGGLPECGFRVVDEKRAWKEGEWLIFIDAQEHEAWNNTESNRYILVIDIIREKYSHKKFYISTVVLTGLFLQKIAETFPMLYKLQGFLNFRKIMVHGLLPFCFVAVRVRNWLSKWGWVS